MPDHPRTRARARPGLTREHVLRAAIELADEAGVEALTMRRLGRTLGVEAMSLYHHVDGKSDLLDGMMELLVDGIPRVPEQPAWRTAMREQILAARSVVLAHPWLPGLAIARSAANAAILRYADWIMGLLLAGGLPNQLIHDGMHVLGSRVLGFAQDIFDPNELRGRLAGQLQELRPDLYPRLFEAIKGVHHDDEEEFEFGLDLILDGLERAHIGGGAG
ncbi:MAG: TetR family transcriptional regulator [Anaerolinea sp.]|nr:TetR family transcriptional regulator [Anaerolinea sp.]